MELLREEVVGVAQYVTSASLFCFLFFFACDDISLCELLNLQLIFSR